MLALVDADVIAYRCAASCEPNKEKLEREPLDLAIKRADELAYRILNTTQTDQYRFFISGSENFRKLIYPDYKANRLRLQRPEWLDSIREFLVEEWKAEITAGYEADDGIGIAAKGDFVICSNDKDFLQIPGHHYNFVKDEFKSVNEYDAAFSFWNQMLVGDMSDNVRGVDGIGTVKSKRALDGLSPNEMERTVIKLYQNRDRYLLTHRLLRIIRSEEEWKEIENGLSKSQGTKFTEAHSTEDTSPFSTINS